MHGNGVIDKALGTALSFQVAQQTAKRLLVGIMVFPVGKVANMTSLLNILRPRGVTRQDSIIYADGKQDIGDTLRFFIQRFFHFVGYPVTSYRVLRKYQQQFVILSDSFVNAWADFVPNFHIFWCEPAAHSTLLQVSMKSFGKGFIVTGIADKAGVIFDGFASKRFHIFQKRFGYTSTKNKRFGDISLRFVDTGDTQRRRTPMYNCLQSFNDTQITVSKLSTLNYCTFEVGIFKISIFEVGSSEVGIAEVSTSEVSTSEVGIVEMSTCKDNIGEMSTCKDNIGEVGTAEVGIAEVGPAEVGSVEVGISEVGATKIGIDKTSIHQVGIAEVGSAEVGIQQVSISKFSTAEVGIAEVNISKDCISEVRTAEVSISEVNTLERMFHSPSIPVVNFLLDLVYLFLICHIVLLLSLCDGLSIEEFSHIRKWGNLARSSATSKSHCSKYIRFST